MKKRFQHIEQAIHMEPKTVKVWTDGSCNNKTGKNGGYGVVMYIDDTKITYSGGQFIGTTSARMEIAGVISAMKRVTPDYHTVIHCDNEYVVKSLQEGWVFGWEKQNWVKGIGKRNNHDLWKIFLEEYRRLRAKVDLVWTRGHANDENNVLADKLAGIGAKKSKKVVDDEAILRNKEKSSIIA